MISLTQWTSFWASSRRWWWTGKPGVLQSMGSRRVGRDWATELNWKVYYMMAWYIYIQYPIGFFIFLAVLGLRWGTRASLAVVPGLNYPLAYGILVPRPGMESVFPALEGRFLTIGPPGKFLQYHVVDDRRIVCCTLDLKTVNWISPFSS